MIFQPKGKRVPDDVFLSFNKNDIGSINILELIYPNEKISNTSKIPVFKILGVSLDQSFFFILLPFEKLSLYLKQR